MRRTLTAAVLGLLVASTVATAHDTRHGKGHREGCWSARCDHRADALWARHHRPKVRLSAFDACVANNETGEPGSRNPAFINWHASGTYSGAFQFDEGTWAEAGGTRYSPTAGEATKRQQLIVFHRFEPGHASRWPNTIPPCL